MEIPFELIHSNSAPSEMSIPNSNSNITTNNDDIIDETKIDRIGDILQSPPHSKYSKILPLSCNPYFHELLTKDELSKLKKFKNTLINDHNVPISMIQETHLLQFLLSRNSKDKTQQFDGDFVSSASKCFLAQMKLFEQYDLHDIPLEVVLHEIKKGKYLRLCCCI